MRNNLKTTTQNAKGIIAIDKIIRTILVRTAFITILIGSAIAANLYNIKSRTDLTSSILLLLIAATIASGLFYAFWIKMRWNLRQLIYVQMQGDLLTAGILVLLTGATDSVFPFLFFIAILNGANMLGRRGALFAATGATVSLLAVYILHFTGIPFLAKKLPTIAAQHHIRVYPILIHVVAFYAVGLLSGYLAQMLGKAGSEIAKKDTDIRELLAINASIVRSIQSGLISLSHDGKITFFNQAAVQITGIFQDEAIDKPLLEVLPSFDALLDEHFFKKLWIRPEIKIIRKNKTIATLGVNISALTSESGQQKGSLIIFQDLTEIRKLENAIKQKEHLAAIGELSAAMAHEIRNPLAAITGSVQTLEMILETQDSDQIQLLEIIGQETDRLNNLITEFLEFARPVRSSPEIMLFSDIILQTINAFQKTLISEQIEIINQCEKNPSFVNIDPNKLQQVIWNLLNNASEAMMKKGIIWISTHRLMKNKHEWIELTVEDDGPGFEEGISTKIFAPFFTTKDEGTGLGLAISHRIIVDHNGLMQAENREEGGAKFSVLLPVYKIGKSSSKSKKEICVSETAFQTPDKNI